MKKNIIFIILLTLLFSSIGVYADVPVVEAQSVIVIDSKSGKVLYEKDADAKRYPASTTKIMTGILAIEDNKLDKVVTIRDDVPGQIERASTHISLIPGEQLTMEQLLYGMLLESANDAAVAIAEEVGGNVDKFADMMNEKAKAIGAANTHFVNPNGLHNDNHYTTARDLAAIARYAMTNQKFRDVVSTVKYTIPKTNKQEERNYITNGNRLIWKNFSDFRYPYAIGIKTGYTAEAQRCLVAGAKKDGMELIVVLLADKGNNIYTDSMALFDWAFANFKTADLLKKDQIVTTVQAKTGKTMAKINLLAADNFSILVGQSETDSVKSTIKTRDNLNAPIHKGDKLGTITYTLGANQLKTIDLVSSQDLLPPKPAYSRIWKVLLIIVVLFLLFRTVITIIKVQKRKRRNRLFYVKRY